MKCFCIIGAPILHLNIEKTVYICFSIFSRKIPDVTPIVSDQKPSVSKSGRKIKGRGTIVCLLRLFFFQITYLSSKMFLPIGQILALILGVIQNLLKELVVFFIIGGRYCCWIKVSYCV